jgi:hypothetical protein
MNWDEVPAWNRPLYQWNRPLYQRNDLGLIYPCRWSPVMRELWHALVELGDLTLYNPEAINWDDAENWVMTQARMYSLWT